MNTQTKLAQTEPSPSSSHWFAFHPISSNDSAAAAAARAYTEPMKGRLLGTAARTPFDEIMGHVPMPADVVYEQATVGGVPGWWCRPAQIRNPGTILYLHGGWHVWGSARAYRALAGHVAVRSGVATFVADYRLAPEHPLTAGLDDAQACYRSLEASGLGPIALVGDSAGGGLALALAARSAADGLSGKRPAAVVAFSPLTDLTLSGPSWDSRAGADPYFTKAQGVAIAQLALGNLAPTNPEVSPLYGQLQGLPPVRVQVGDDEVLLDDALRYVERAVVAGVDAKVDVWQGLPHVFLSSAGRLEAADQALESVGAFLGSRLAASA